MNQTIMQYIWMGIKGMFIGISNIIPGVSGGTMAVSFGIYDDIIHALTHVRKDFKTSAKILGPLIVGVLMGIAVFSRVIDFLLVNYTFPTAIAFIGLILGGLPILWKSFQESLQSETRSLNFVHIILFILMFAVVAWMGIADVSGGGVQELEVTTGTLIALFFVGMISAAAMVIPGISGSLLMLIIGYYYAFLFVINGFTSALSSFSMTELIPFTILLAAFGIGMIVGIVLISKVIDYLFKNFPSFTYAGILGLVLASPIAILTNTEAFASIDGHGVLYILIALVLGIACFFVTYLLGKTDDPTEELEHN
jgi:putative membrane protein